MQLDVRVNTAVAIAVAAAAVVDVAALQRATVVAKYRHFFL